MNEFEVLRVDAVATVEVDGVLVTRVVDEIDMTTVGVVRAEITKRLDSRPESLVLDLSGVRFFDSSGLTMLVEGHRHAQELGVRLAVVADHHAVLMPLDMSGVLPLLEVRPTVPDAIRSLRNA